MPGIPPKYTETEMKTHVRLTGLPAALLHEGYAAPPCHRKLREWAIDCRFPAVQINGIWHFDPAQIHVIAAAFGLTADRAAA
jgi:hypothetical protein